MSISPPTADDLRQMTPKEFRDIIGHFASGVTVITALHGGQAFGATASAVSSLSLEPPMVLICLNKTSTTQQAVAGSGRFAVNILGEDQADEAMRFATKKTADKFKGLSVVDGEWGEPLLGDALAILECRVVEEVTGGTHSVFLAEVDRASARTGTPLAYFRGQFGRLQLEQDESAFRDIRARVLNRDIPIGEPLSLEDVAGLVGAPRGPVYHAMAKLTSEGLMTRDADGAFFVTPLGLEAVEMALRARYAIELGVARLTVGKVPDDRLAELRVLRDNTEPERTFDQGGWDAYLPAYHAFHEGVIALADSAALVDAYRRVNAPAMIISMTSGRLAESGDDRQATATSFDHHGDLLTAYEGGDLEAANAAILAHIEYSLLMTRKFMDAAGGQI
ncbi:MAG: 4-nitrophenol 2-monooxygenase / 4-nitrocatechol 4-monooxygenase, reductase component [Baekduia sp.]|nr:4-nitrophenol 2-monooxygenase / 4-nitrocatechol 4-monooxygenase, reductase component [Baekduia sp.]